MDHPRSASANGDDVGIPDDLRCKRSDGKQWRCTAMSMPDKTVCEKHYIQAKKRAANSAMRAHLKKAKRKSLEEGDLYLEDNKSDEFDAPLSIAEQSQPGKKSAKSQARYSPDTPPTRSLPARNSSKHDDSQRDLSQYEENWKPSKTTAADSSRNMSQKSFDANATTEYSDGSTNSSEEIGGQTCHQCRKNDRDGVAWCLKCDKRGYCSNCISSWYLDIPFEEIQKICPACRGICNCRACLRSGNLIKVRIREIPVLDKLKYLHSLLASVLPVIKQIHVQQCLEVELEKRICGADIYLARAKLNADEQMCCNFCRIPIIDYHRHCQICNYDLCLSCCQDLREASTSGNSGGFLDNGNGTMGQDEKLVFEQVYRQRLKFSDKISNWKANCDGNIPCPPREYGGCGYYSLSLSRIFKMNWVAKLVKNVEEMVGGCRIHDSEASLDTESIDPSLFQCAHRDNGNDNFLYFPTSSEIRSNGISDFRKHWARGKPIIVRQVFDSSTIASWDPAVIWRGIQDTTDERMKDENQIVKAINCSDQSEVSIELVQFIEGYFNGRISENGRPEMLRLKDWPSPSASEEFILYQRPEFIVKLPLLEYIHSKWGILNVAAKLPHYSLQNDVGPKFFISYGAFKEPSPDDSVTNLSINMRDMVYLLVHAHSVKPKDAQEIDIECTENTTTVNSVVNEVHGNEEMCSIDGGSAERLVHGHGLQDEHEAGREAEMEVTVSSHEVESNSAGEKAASSKISDRDIFKRPCLTAVWDVFCRKDVPKLTEYLRLNWKEFGKSGNKNDDLIMRPIFDEALYLNEHHKRKLKEEFGVEPWTFEQHLGEAVFVPAGRPFQIKNFQSNVQLGLDFLSPESVGEAARLGADIRCLPNDHEAKLQVLEVGKISLYAASSVIKEVQKLVLDPKLSEEVGFEDPNLTAAVSENLERMTKRRQISCA